MNSGRAYGARMARGYTMGARADAVRATREAILRATFALATERLTVDITLEDVAARAGVSARTVLRHFGSFDALFDAAVEAAYAEVVAEREPPGDGIEAAIRVLVDHYELRGDLVIRMLAQEDDPRIAPIVSGGRLTHRAWVEAVFAAALPREAAARQRLVDELVVVTDVYAWKLLRRDRGLDRAQTELRLRELAAAVAAVPAGPVVPVSTRPSEEEEAR